MHILARGDLLQRLRLISGLLLFIFAAAHFLNTAIGLYSPQFMDDVDQWRRVVIRSLPGTIVFGLALVVHMTLGVWKIASRRTLSLPWWELAQIGLGVLIPFLLLPHIVNTRIASQFFGVNDNYLYELARLWPNQPILQSTLLVLVWLHGCIGIHYWLRLHAPYRAMQPVLLFIAIAVPLAALGGFMVAGRSVAELIQDPAAFARVKEVTNWPDATAGDLLAWYRALTRLGFLAVLGLLVLVFAYRYVYAARASTVKITFAGGPAVTVPKGSTLLEISRMNRIPHASVCGGRARCSTCRVRIDEGADTLPPPVFPETVTLAAIDAPANVRLACQIRPEHPITVTRLLRPLSTGPQATTLVESDASGSERHLAVLYVNMRDYHALARRKLPYDVVFLLNQYFTAIGAAVRSQGGTVDKVLGDGLVAVFGQRVGPDTACRQALRAVRAIDLALDHVNALLAPDLGRAIEVSAGLETGLVIMGRMGFGDAVDLTVVGPPVRSAIALEKQARQHGTQLAVSTEVARLAGWEADPSQIREVDIDGETHPVRFVEVSRGRDLAANVLASASAERRPSQPVSAPR